MVTPVMPTYGRADVAFDRGEGAYITDTNGRRYLDFGAGIAVTCLGHANPRLIAAVTEQAGKLWHCSNLYQIPGQIRLAEKLVANSFADTVFFGNSGAEANEGAIKIARKYQSTTGHPERYRIITFEGAFHGRTLATLAAGGQKKHLDGFGPVVDGFDQVAKVGDIKLVEAAITDKTAAIMIEPVQGEGGIRNIAPEFLEQLRALCDKHGLMLIFDEVQTGMGRTGKLFGYEWSNIKPDIMSLGKGLGGGFPIGAVLATEKAAVGMTPGTHGSTYGGNPLACSAGNAVVDTMLEPGFLQRVNKTADRLWSKLRELMKANDSVIEELRGKGLLIGLKVRVPNGDLVKALRAEGLLAVEAGDNVVRFAPALIVGDKEVDEALAILERVCRNLTAKAAASA
jgi:acetylornithine/N-succinyldiaminopimelate aminotransferase